jgi:hypothetical protein
MEIALNEVKTQAKKLLKAIKTDTALQQKLAVPLKTFQLESIEALQLKHCLTLVSQQLGFSSWHHAQTILSGSQTLANRPDMGTAFYTKACGGLINLWFADYLQAKAVLNNQATTRWLLPYQKQFIVVEKDYLDLLKMSEGCEKWWHDINHDLYGGYNSPAWDNLTYLMIRKRK